MSIEAIVSRSNVVENDIEESSEDPRISLHHELAEVTRKLGELYTRHTNLNLAMIALGESGDPAMLQKNRRDCDELISKITGLREKQAELIVDTSYCNTRIWRPPCDNDWFNEHEKIRNKDERARLERPYVNALYNDGEDPADLSSVNEDEEISGNRFRYLPNAAL